MLDHGDSTGVHIDYRTDPPTETALIGLPIYVPPPPTAEERIADLEAKLVQAEPTPDDIPATANPLAAQVAQLSATVEALTGELDRLKVVDAATIEATAKDATASKELIAKVADAFGISWDEADKVRLTDAKRWGEWLTKLGIGGDPKADGGSGVVIVRYPI